MDNDHFRRRCSVAKFLKGPARKFGLDISDEKANRIAFLVGQHFPDSNDYAFEVLYGDDAVREAYFSDASLDWGSCMHGRRYVDWYAENKESVGVLKILRGGKFVGRALLWTAMNGTTILDRIYPSDNGGHTAAAHEYARVNGWEYKTRQSMQDGCLTSGDKPHLIAMKPSSSGQYPYLDTFKYTDDNPDDGDTIHLSLLAGKFCFNDTSGDYSGRESQIVCSSCSRQVNEDCAEYYDGDPYCEDCFAENFVQLDYQLPGGSWVQGEFHRDDVTNCGSCESDRRNRDVRSVLVGSNEETWCRLCIDDNADTCECCGELCAIEHAVQVYDVIYCSRACSVAEEAPEVVVDVLPAPELEFVYPARYSYAAYCCFPSCACREIRRRRDLAFPYDGAIGSWAQDEAIRHFRSCWIEAPYPNVLELEAIDRQDQADRVARETEEAYSGLAPNQWTMSAEELGLATATPEPDVAVAGLGAPLRGIMGTITGGASVPTPDRSWSELALFGLTLT